MSATTSLSPLIDADSHVLEPDDLWTSRISPRWGDDIPHVRFDEKAQAYRWVVGGIPTMPSGGCAAGLHDAPWPNYPASVADSAPGAYDPVVRAALLDDYGIRAQVIYPNLVSSFAARVFMKLDPRLGLECVQAYNDFLTGFSAAAPGRYIAVSAIPFWDVEQSVAEIERCKAMGHQGVLLAAFFHNTGLPDLVDDRWTPILDVCQSLELPLNFHVGFGSATDLDGNDVNEETYFHAVRSLLTVRSGTAFNSSAQAISLMTAGGICHNFPRLKFVSVESGFGHIPFTLDALDWFFVNYDVPHERPEWDKPSEYFRRQGFATMFFERAYPDQLEAWQDNVMWETDFPHPNCIWPGPYKAGLPAQQQIETTMAGVKPAVRDKVLFGNAARLYGIS